MEEMGEGKFYFFLLKSVRPGSDAEGSGSGSYKQLCCFPNYL